MFNSLKEKHHRAISIKCLCLNQMLIKKRSAFINWSKNTYLLTKFLLKVKKIMLITELIFKRKRISNAFNHFSTISKKLNYSKTYYSYKLLNFFNILKRKIALKQY